MKVVSLKLTKTPPKFDKLDTEEEIRDELFRYLYDNNYINDIYDDFEKLSQETIILSILETGYYRFLRYEKIIKLDYIEAIMDELGRSLSFDGFCKFDDDISKVLVDFYEALLHVQN